MNTTHRITIIGAGFGALSSVREIRQRDPHAEITLIAPRAELHYLPGIIWIPSGLRTREQLIVPLANFFAAHEGAPRRGRGDRSARRRSRGGHHRGRSDATTPW